MLHKIVEGLRNYCAKYQIAFPDNLNETMSSFVAYVEKCKMEGRDGSLNEFYHYLYAESFSKYHQISKFGPPTELWEVICLSGDSIAVSYLFDSKLINKDTKNALGMNPLHLTAQSGNVQAMRKAMESGIEIDSTDPHGSSAIHFAAASGYVDVMQRAIESGADIHAINSLNMNVYDFAKRFGSAKTEERSLDLGVGSKDRVSEREPFIREQEWFINLMHSMGYQVSPEGVCLGVAQMAMQEIHGAKSVAAGAKSFDDRFRLIQSYVGDPERLKKDIEQAQSAVRNKEKLTEKQEKMLEISGLFDGIAIHAGGGSNYYEVFDASKPFRSVSGSMQAVEFTTPEKILKNGGKIDLAHHEQEFGDLDGFLNVLKSKCESHSLVVSSTLNGIGAGGKGHAINISYDPKEKCWYLIDANRLPTRRFNSDDFAGLKQAITDALSFVSPYIYESLIYVHHDKQHEAQVSKFTSEWSNQSPSIELQDFPKLFEHLEKNNVLPDENSLLFWVKKYIDNNEEADLTSYLENQGHPELAKKVSQSKADQLWQCICLSGDSAAISWLIENKFLNKNTVDSNGMNPLHWIARSGNPDALMLAAEKLGIDTKAVSKVGENIYHQAAKIGDAEMMGKIAALDPSICTAVSYFGATALHYAAIANNKDAMQKAVEAGIDPIKKDRFGDDILSITKGSNPEIHEFATRLYHNKTASVMPSIDQKKADHQYTRLQTLHDAFDQNKGNKHYLDQCVAVCDGLIDQYSKLVTEKTSARNTIGAILSTAALLRSRSVAELDHLSKHTQVASTTAAPAESEQKSEVDSTLRPRR